ncbi:unnamed protein product [Miscanthus lutarioriparius]|uniref:Uncharacterized protein n=1 Tax=Miscanthus lutarioriparius TaxID=422564 RepID=A0A811N5A3_9POAL|nr:unnamed protein product [Miscanthus lutarioriparius]
MPATRCWAKWAANARRHGHHAPSEHLKRSGPRKKPAAEPDSWPTGKRPAAVLDPWPMGEDDAATSFRPNAVATLPLPRPAVMATRRRRCRCRFRETDLDAEAGDAARPSSGGTVVNLQDGWRRRRPPPPLRFLFLREMWVLTARREEK